jgi:surface protein
MAFNPILLYEYGKSRGSRIFISSWKTDNLSTGSSTSTQVKLPLEISGTYNFVVDWGDSTTSNITTYDQAETTHTYAVAGTYTLSITGIIIGWSFKGLGDRLKILNITKWGTLRLGNSGNYFGFCANIKLNTITDILNLTGTLTLAGTFQDCTLLTTVGRMNEWNTSLVNDLTGMFQMTGASTNGIGVFNQNIGNWNVSNVTSFANMFRFTALFNNGGVDSIKNWNMTSATNLNAMFSRANSFNQPIADWERTGSTLVNVNNMGDMFSSGNRSFSFNQPIGNWNVSNVTSMANLFYRSPFNQDIGSWNISKVNSWGLFGSAGSVTPFSPTNLDKIYNGWSTRPVKPNQTISFTSKYTTASSAGKSILQGSPNLWIINDGGL